MSRAACGFAPAPKPPAPPLTRVQYALCLLGVPVMAAMFTAGCFGLMVLMDPEGVKPVSQTAFAQRWRWLIQKNLFFQPFAVNFGGIGLLFCISRLVTHHRRPKAEDKGAKAE